MLSEPLYGEENGNYYIIIGICTYLRVLYFLIGMMEKKTHTTIMGYTSILS